MNRLNTQTSPYLRSHANNPVDWYPWCDEAFTRAKLEDKPIFLSIGYSTCHWCHVMARECFEDKEVADLLNRCFISVKVDREERPDIDSVYMSACVALTGSGGWPASIFITPDGKPFYAGTYFPKPHFLNLLYAVRQSWDSERAALLKQSNRVLKALKNTAPTEQTEGSLIQKALMQYRNAYDRQNGGFGRAPKFPAAHNLLFLLRFEDCRDMAKHTLEQMYRGGLFDHIGYGFCRYSTDARFLVPHFEKMLYDNAWLMLAYTEAGMTDVAVKTADFILREMTSPEGGFYSAYDADSEGAEGKYYLFTPDEVISVLGQSAGTRFNSVYDITKEGNFEKKSIPNLLKTDVRDPQLSDEILKLREYRKQRMHLHLDDKILTFWNGLMIAAMCVLYRKTADHIYLDAAKNADAFIQSELYDGKKLYASYREGICGAHGFIDDYASVIFAKLALYGATLDGCHLDFAKKLCKKVISDFYDAENGGFYLYSNDSEQLVLRPKDTYDGAMPCGNSLMAYNFVRLYLLTSESGFKDAAKRQLEFLGAHAAQYPIGHAMYLLAYNEYTEPPPRVTAVAENTEDIPPIAQNAAVVYTPPTPAYPLLNGRPTYYVCRDNTCFAPTNDIDTMI